MTDAPNQLKLQSTNKAIDYITYVFAMAGLKGNNVLLSSSIQYVINVIMTIPALIWLDKWGRRPTLLVGAALMMTWLFIDGGQSTHSLPCDPQLNKFRNYGNLRPSSTRRWPQRHRSRILDRKRQALQSHHRLQLPLRRIIRTDLGPRFLGLPTRALPSPSARQSRSARHVRELGFQLRVGLLRAAGIREYPMENLHCVRRVLCMHVHSCVLHVS